MKNLCFFVVSTVAALFATAHAVTVELDNLEGRTGVTFVNGMFEIEQDGYTIKISAFTVEDNNGDQVFNQLDDGLFSDSLGIGINRNRLDANQVDGFGPNEAVLFEIIDSATGLAVDFNSIAFNAVGFDDDATVFAGSDVDNLEIVYQGDIGGDNGFPLFEGEIVLDDVVASALMVGALEWNDGFFIQSISFQPVPLPGAALLMLGGMGALSFARKQRRAA